MKNNVFLIVGQNFHYNMKIISNETTIVDIFNYFLSNDTEWEHSIKLYQSKKERKANWGEIVYKVSEDGTLQFHDSNVDSSG